MKITIRPAPHSKGCAVAGKEWCSKFNDKSERCENECPAGFCCEMKHCWEVGEILQDILVSRGHEVKMGNKKYRKASTDSKASQNTKNDMKELMAWGPDVHIAIHTNASSSKSAHGVRIGYPQKKTNSDKKRLERSKKLAEFIVAENKKIYWDAAKVATTDGYNFYELNNPTCPAVYIEGCFANSNLQDAEWWHGKAYEIALSYADGLEKWLLSEGEKLPSGSETLPKEEFVTTAIINTSKPAGLYLWDSYKKNEQLIKVAKDEIVNVISLVPKNNFYYCEYKGIKGYADGQYLLFEDKETSTVYAAINTSKNAGLYLWDSYKKNENFTQVAKNEIVEVKSLEDDHGFYLCEYKGVEGWADGQYLLFK